MYNEYLVHDKKLWVRIEDFLEAASEAFLSGMVKCKDCKHRYNSEECPRSFKLNYASCKTGPKFFMIDNTTDESYCEKGEAKDTDD